MRDTPASSCRGGNSEVADQCAFARELSRGLFERGRYFGMGRHVLFVEMPHESHAQTAHAAFQICAEVAMRNCRAARIGSVVARQYVERQRRIAHRARHWPDMVEREREWKHAAPRHKAVRRFQANDAAIARGIAD